MPNRKNSTYPIDLDISLLDAFIRYDNDAASSRKPQQDATAGLLSKAVDLQPWYLYEFGRHDKTVDPITASVASESYPLVSQMQRYPVLAHSIESEDASDTQSATSQRRNAWRRGNSHLYFGLEIYDLLGDMDLEDLVQLPAQIYRYI